MLAIAGVVLLAAVLGAVYFLRFSDPPDTRFTADNTVPFSFDAPGDWTRAGESIDVVFSSHAPQALSVFEPVAGTDSWAAMRPLLADDADNILGLYTSFLTTQYQGATTPELEDIIKRLLPTPVSISNTTANLSVDDQPAVRFDGTLTDPSYSEARLPFECYLVQRPTGEARTVLLLFFSSPQAADKSKDVSTDILASLDFTE
jgi:hypothetical protein